MFCLDTYALWEILKANPRYKEILTKPFVVTDLTLAEFYKTLVRELDKKTAKEWVQRFQSVIVHVPLPVLFQAVDFQIAHKKQRISFFDAVGYMYAISHGYMFVTGDKEFQTLPHVKFLK